VEDHYGVLGIGKRASADEVKRAYRQLSKVYHPDKAGHLDEVERRNRERQMVSLNVAYQVLMSPKQRQEYDLSQPSPRGAAGAAGRRQHASAHGRPSWRPPQAPMPSGGVNPVPTPAPGAGVYTAASAAARMSRPRYQVGSKYTQSSRQARRMDPSQYTVHVDGRAAEFERATSTPRGQGHAPDFERASSTPHGLGSPRRFAASPPAPAAPGQPRNPIWLQRTLDIAREWEQAHCPNREQEDRYEWKNACGGLLQGLRERRQNRAAAAGHSHEGQSQPVAAAA